MFDQSLSSRALISASSTILAHETGSSVSLSRLVLREMCLTDGRPRGASVSPAASLCSQIFFTVLKFCGMDIISFILIWMLSEIT